MGNKLEISLLGKLRREPLINAARGILPVATLWGTAPTNLINATDENTNTVTGTGVSVVGSATTIGRLDLTFPTNAIYLVGIKVGIWSTVGNITLKYESAPDGTTLQDAGPSLISRTSTTEAVVNTAPFLFSGKQLGIRFASSGAMTASVKIYEIWSYKIG